MGTGRKTQTFYGDSFSFPPLSGDGTIGYRNLDKKDLGGVIFGCKHNTMQECLSKQLFGLPHGHFTYVRNIGEDLPLFLFNYSDRKLHGIYESASNGHMSFDVYAWTNGGSEKTPFPAQVQIRTKMQCLPLTENQFGKVIKDNYYSQHLFWFELDHAQTRALISLFKPSSSSYNSLPPIKKDPFPVLPSKYLVPLPTTKWNYWKDTKKAGNSTSNKILPTGWGDEDSKDAVSDWEELADDNGVNQLTFFSEKKEYSDKELEKEDLIDDNGGNDNCSFSEKKESSNEELEKEEERVLCLLQKLVAEREQLKASSSGGTFIEHDNNHENAGEDVQISKVTNGTIANGHEMDEENSTIFYLSHRNAELLQVIEQLKERTSNLEKQRAEQDREMKHLKDAYRNADKEIQFLNSRVKELELKTVSLSDVIYLIGGFDGCSWLSALDCFSPSHDVITPLQPMNNNRSYMSSVALDGIIYVFGGGDGNLWFDSVESYNRVQDKWTTCTSMLREKGSLGGATLNGKIYVIGGGNGREYFPDVEMFDPIHGSWIRNQSMLQTRFAPAAAELNGALYALGGYNGNEYMRSVERYDPREGIWAEAPSMRVRRGCHSVVVFNEKLYCMGGYDGERMVSSLEIFDPRLDSWVMGEPLNTERGFAAATVLGNSIISLGGLKDDKVILDTAECYREGAGWTISRCNAIGKRCFCSAIVT